jgi:hypothetical protein
MMGWSAVVVAGMIATAGLWAQEKQVQDAEQSKELSGAVRHAGGGNSGGCQRELMNELCRGGSGDL